MVILDVSYSLPFPLVFGDRKLALRLRNDLGADFWDCRRIGGGVWRGRGDGGPLEVSLTRVWKNERNKIDLTRSN